MAEEPHRCSTYVNLVRRVFVSVEGQTEETFVRDVLRPHFIPSGLHLQEVILKTSRSASGRGGVSKWAKIEADLRALLGDSNATAITTMYDLYGIPADTPGFVAGPDAPAERLHQMQAAVESYFGDSRFRFNLLLHEFEALVLCNPAGLAQRAADPHLKGQVEAVVQTAGGPERVNDQPTTAPSKRLGSWWPQYSKLTDGPALVAESGLAAVRSQCPTFDAWLTWLESL